MFKRFLYIFLFLLAGVAAFAQQYPVQGSLAIASPYPANLSDYANSNIQSLALNLTLTDLTMANKRVRLKVFIQTQNATIAQSIDNISGEALIMLDGGIPQRFTNAELAHYFRLENLQGINPDGYARSLPEGVYTIGFEVYDYFTGNKLSGRIAQTFWIIINDPPLLNTPQDKSKIADFTSGSRGTGGIIFNWTPRSTQVSNTEYEFTLCELWDATGDAYQQFMSAIPKYQTTVSNSTTLIYSLAQPTLISGYTYAWRVRAKAKAGFEDIGLYRNDGYSNLFTFRYGDPCPAPQSLALEAKTSDAIAATWDAPIGATTGGVRYKIAYRKYSAAGQWSWAETETSDLFRTISGLEPATEYELKVGVPCNQTNEVVYTPSQRATTMAAGQISGIECGKEPTIDLSKQTLLTLLKAGDVVIANDFPTTITRVTGTSQGWSGEAWTKVPWLGDTRIHVTYASIKVNSDYKLIDGSFITTYDPTGKNIGDIDKTIDDAVGLYTGGTDVGKVVTGDAATSYTVPYTITPADTGGSSFTANTTGGGTITLGNGQTLTVSNLPTTVQDAAGTVYQADDKGKLTKVGTNSSNAGAMLATTNLTVVDASKGTVTFAPTSDMKYAFDAWQKAYDGNSAWSKRYETLPISGQSGKYRVSSKLMVPGEADKVLAIINLNDKSIAGGSVQFVNATGTVFEKDSITPTSYKINLVGGPAGDAQEVYALYSTGGKTYTLGKLLVATYEPKTINLALVPVNGATLDSKAIAAELKKVYESLGIDFNLTTKDKFEYEALETASLKVEGSGLLSVYTEQMKALNAAFVAKGDYDKNTIYLFAIDQPESQDGKSIEGVMPRGQQFGYLFVKGKEGDAQGLTATHEIGHGVFQLQHAFDYSGIKQKAITPLNVMDYPAGEALSKLQWDLMNDPGLVISVFETDKGAEMGTVDANELIKKYEEFAANYPNGLYLALHGYTCSESPSTTSMICNNPEFSNMQMLYSKTLTTANGAVTAIIYSLKENADNTRIYTQQVFTKEELSVIMKDKLADTDNFLEFYTEVDGKFKGLKKCDNWGVLKDEVCGLVKNYTDISYHLYLQHILDQITLCKPKHILLFVNGYRATYNPLIEKDINADNKLYPSDIVDEGSSYWEQIDTKFIERLKPDITLYADGHDGINTSNHGDKTKFLASMMSSMSTFNPTLSPQHTSNPCYQKDACVHLSTESNTRGFEQRRARGRDAGKNLLNDYPNIALQDTLDIVCHSMGYAYALGMIEVLKDKVTFGRFYIIAPENAGAGNVNMPDWKEVWQYGADLNRKDGQKSEPLYYQDGVAPQVTAGGLFENRRVYIPSNVTKGFVISHSIGNYGWIFKLTPPVNKTQNINGYVIPR